MLLRLLLSLTPLLVALPTHARAAQDVAAQAPDVVRAEEVAALSEEARAAIVEFYGESVEQLPTPVRVVDRETLIEGLVEDLRPQLAVQLEAEFVDVQARAQAEAVGPALFARYVTAANELHVCLENVESIAELFESPELASTPVVRAIMVHEFVHARDARDHDFAKLLTSVSTTDAMQGLQAVIEGHAQYVARQVCAARGWTQEFERFTASITEVPPGIEEPAMRLMAQVMAQTFGFYYVDGERFVAAIAEARGPEGLPGLFAAPPSDPGQVLRPEWYLDPSTRPESVVDIDAGLDRFAAIAIPEAYNANRVSIVPGQLRASMAGVEKPLVERFVGAVVSVKVHVGGDPERPGALRSAALFEFSSPGEALAGLIAQRAVMVQRDRDNQEGMIRITSANYVDLAVPSGERGMVVRKTVSAFGGEQQAATVLLVRGPAMIEMSSFDDVTDTDLLTDWALKVLAAASGEAPEDESAEEPAPDGDVAPEDEDA